MKIEIYSKNKKVEVKVIPVYENDDKKIIFFDKKLETKKIVSQINLFNFKAKDKEILFFNLENDKYLILGVKKDYTLEDLRRSYSVAFDFLKSKDIKNILFEVPKENDLEISSIVESLDLTDYSFDKYISKKKDDEKIDMNCYLNVSNKYKKLILDTLVVCKNVKFARNLVNENSNIITPKKLEILAKDFAKKNRLKIKILDEKLIVKEKLGLLWAVGKGSEFKPRLIILEYLGDLNSTEKIALVGKGITFDTGGINLKPSGFLEDMKSDMAGAAAVFGTFISAVELGLKKNLILVIPTAENAISSQSYKPGDVFIGYNGKSVEIGNTDAEGRLILSDSLSYLQKNYKPTKIIDVATLTGACLIALGPSLIAMLGNDEQMKKQIFKSGENTFERVWELPIYDEHRDLIKSNIADVKNIGSSRFGGTITAAAFLENFIQKGIKWTHLDIAGAARSDKKEFYVSQFGTGRGVRLLFDWLKNN